MRRKLAWALLTGALGLLLTAGLLGLWSVLRAPENGLVLTLDTLMPAGVAASLVCGVLGFFARNGGDSSLQQPRGLTPPGSPVSDFTSSRLPKTRTSRHLMIARFTPNYQWLEASHALQKYLRKPVRALRKYSLLEWVHPEDVAALDQAFEAARNKGSAGPLNIRLFHRPKRGRTSDAGTASKEGVNELAD